MVSDGRVSPSSEATREQLIRRLSLDLTGLPPSPAEVEAFVSDQRRDAYEKLVDRLLGSRHFGERLALPWDPSKDLADLQLEAHVEHPIGIIQD